jgi:hypothetical protein
VTMARAASLRSMSWTAVISFERSMAARREDERRDAQVLRPHSVTLYLRSS